MVVIKTPKDTLRKSPSPKGLGYCARCTPIGVTMKVKDGNLWENKSIPKEEINGLK